VNVADVMTVGAVTVEEDATLDEAMELMDRFQLRHLPVVRGDTLAGIVSDRDLLGATGWEPVHLGGAEGPAREQQRLDQLMQRSVVSVTPDDTVVTAALELLMKRIGCLPVVEDRRLVGIMTERDLLVAWLDQTEAEPSPGVAVAQLMTRDLATLSSHGTLAQAIELCRGVEVRHLPVVEEGRLVGVVSDRDLKRALGIHRPPETRVDELMTRDVVSLPADSQLLRAAQLMHAHHISAVPIVSGDQLVGILTLSDLLTHCMETLREPDRT
jgi:CBS domain-containing protein